MTFGFSTARSLAFGTALTLVGLTPALAQDAIVPGAFLVAQTQGEPRVVMAPLPPARGAATQPRTLRTASVTPVRATVAPQRVAFADPLRPRRMEGYTSFSTRPNFMMLGVVY